MRCSARAIWLIAGVLCAALLPSTQTVGHENQALPLGAASREATAARAGEQSGTHVRGESGIIAALRAKGAAILALGERGGLDGHFVQLSDGDAYGLYLTPDGYAVTGLLYAPDGTLVTGRQIAAAEGNATVSSAAVDGGDAIRSGSRLGGRDESLAPGPRDAGVPPEPVRLAHLDTGESYLPDAEALFERSASAFGFTMGRSGPPVVLFADPACRWSRSAAVRLGHAALDGRLRLRVVPVGVLGAASAREAAAIASAADPALAWFEGTRVHAEPAGARRIEDNNALYDRWGANAVPLIAWRSGNGRVVHRLGDMDDPAAWLEALPRE